MPDVGIELGAAWMPSELASDRATAPGLYGRNHQPYDASLLTRYYTQHALRPFIDSETNHKRHFIKNPFINKRIEFIDLPSIFKNRSVTSSIPTYFQNSEPPIICYKYNKPLRNTVFNLNKLVSDLDIH